MRAGRINVLGILILAVVAVAGAYAWTFGPYYLDHQKMNDVVRATALAWQDRGEDFARQRFQEELVNRDVPTYLNERTCDFIEHAGTYRVSCEWTVQQAWPLIGRIESIEFVSSAARNEHGWVD